MPRPVLGESCITSIRDFAIFPPHQKKEKKNVLLETPLHPQKVTVWCGFHAGGVIGPYFFVDENDRHVT